MPPATQPARIDILQGNLLSREDCKAACKGAAVIFHLAAGTGEKSFPEFLVEPFVREDGPVPTPYREILLTARIMDAIF